MHEYYDIDLEEPGLLEARSWRWLCVRIKGLLDGRSRLFHELWPPTEIEG